MEERKYWLEAVEKFRLNIDSIVACPNCQQGFLTIKDVAFNDEDISKGGERFIECPICDKFEIVLYRIPPKNWYSKNI